MFSYPKTPKEIDGFFKDFFEVCEKLYQTSCDFQQGSYIPQTADDTMFHGNQIITPYGYHAFSWEAEERLQWPDKPRWSDDIH